MIVNCFYEENMKYCDIIYLPSSINYDIDDLEHSFYRWLFDKNNNHKYWVIKNNQKSYCEYGTDAFIEWINDNFFVCSNEKAFIKKKDALEWNENDKKIVF